MTHGPASSDAPRPSAAAASPPGLVRGRAITVHLLLLAFAGAVLWRGATVQLVASERLKARADSLVLRDIEAPAPRGAILDARGDVLADSRLVYRVVITPREVRHEAAEPGDTTQAQRLALALARFGMPRGVIAKAMNRKGEYLQLPRRLYASEMEQILPLRGVRAYAATERVPPSGSAGLQLLVGRVGDDGHGRSGIEAALDSVLMGARGTRRTVRDGSGRVLESPARVSDAARPGHAVQLTVDATLQEIVERALLEAVKRHGATGGDVIVLDPHDGHVLALAGVRERRPATSLTPLVESYEPGSVLKPFVVAHLLDRGRVRLDEVLDVHGGRWRPERVPKVIEDDHKADVLSVFDVVRWSSNVGTAKLVLDRLPPNEEYELFRDLGFGTYTGIAYPSESRGSLPGPAAIGRSPLTAVQLATGYALAVTPLQLAVAYATLANGGTMVEPSLVREVRDADGRVVFRHEPRPLRRVFSEEAAAAARAMIKAVVDSGTARLAALELYDLGGKTGTAQRALDGGGYDDEHYNATFASVFPMADPQLVIVARLIDPTESIYGGVVAAPLVRDVLRDAIAASDAALDRRLLARVARVVPVEQLVAGGAPMSRAARDARGVVARGASGGASATSERADTAPPPPVAPTTPGRVILSLPLAATAPNGDDGPADASPRGSTRGITRGGTRDGAPASTVTVPDVTGLELRAAASRLHAAGVRVDLTRVRGGEFGVVQRTRPAAGARVREGSVVRLEAGR